ncbi:N-acetylmuramoyl-L-alanine amidase [Allocoleopsis sp.]|uniref:N-acetylmuramoyl-L-alanine amidase n=1 Tax=Allocoleopsis sp. TaxID=3088169 RepID=UPI002FD37CF4
MMKFQWLLLLPSLSSIFLVSSPAEAAKLLMWRFDSNQNQLVFTTDDSVQPKAQLYANPTRLIIDLPGTTLGRPTLNQPIAGAIREVRVGQYNSQMTRIVVELAPGYTIDPRQVLFQALSPSQWSVQLPTPERITTTPRTTSQPVAVISPPRASTPSIPPLDTATSANRLAIIEAIELVNEGTQLVIRADQRVRATSRWNARANTYQILIPNAQLAGQLRGPQLDARSAISQILVRQQDRRTVAILVKPSRGTQIGELNQLTDQLLALQLRQTRAVFPPTGSIPPVRPPIRTTTPDSFSRVPYGRTVVVIDPGHGGKDAGAIGIGGLREKDIILAISLQVAASLQQQGIQVVMTRSDDRFISLEGRVQIARQVGASAFVSIHANSISLRRPDVNGIETYYFSSQRLAQAIHYSILQSLSTSDRGVRQARFYVLRNNSMPATLVEVGYVTGAGDASRLASPAYQRQMAEAIARGILLYLRQNY